MGLLIRRWLFYLSMDLVTVYGEFHLCCITYLKLNPFSNYRGRGSLGLILIKDIIALIFMF